MVVWRSRGNFPEISGSPAPSGFFRDVMNLRMSDRPAKEAQNRLARFNEARDRLLADDGRRVLGRALAGASRGGPGGEPGVAYALNALCYGEIRRPEGSRSRSAKQQLERWRSLAARLRDMTEEDKRSELRELVRWYGRDIV